jgi:hypothetical protein
MDEYLRDLPTHNRCTQNQRWENREVEQSLIGQQHPLGPGEPALQTQYADVSQVLQNPFAGRQASQANPSQTTQ